MHGVLPKAVLRRRKTGLRCETLMERIRRVGLAPFVPAPGLSAYVDPARVPAGASKEMWEFGADLRARALNLWLQNYLNLRQN